MIFTVFPELGDYIQVYEIIFSDPNEIFNYVKEILDKLEIAIKNNDLSVIEPCPEFMNDNEKCPLIKECHMGNIKGCKRI